MVDFKGKINTYLNRFTMNAQKRRARFLAVVPRSATLASPKNLLEMQVSRTPS